IAITLVIEIIFVIRSHNERVRAFWIRAKESPGWVPDFMKENDDKEQNDGGGFNVHESSSYGGDSDVEGENHSGDPFSIYKLLKKKKDNVEKENNSEHSMKYPPGFTPKEGTDVVGGSILSLMDELVKVGKVMRYKMDGCMSNMTEIIESQGVKEEKHMLWDYLTYKIGQWKGEVVIMGDFNKVRYKSDKSGSVFSVQGANVFNSFITNAGLEEVPLGGSSFTWCHKFATKMSKLDRFFISDLLNTCPNITAITLERYLSDHRPILLRESHFDYGPTPFRFFHHWIEMEGFSKVMKDAWREGPCDESNEMINMVIKLKYLKTKIQERNKKNILSAQNVKAKYKNELEALEAIIDKGDGNVEVVNKRMEVVNTLQKIDKICSSEMAQKAKVKWSIEEDENTCFFHGMLNKKQSLLNIQGIMVDVMWIESPNRVKGEFFHHFSSRFDKPDARRAHIEMRYPKTLTCDQQVELESDVSNEEIKRAVVDAGIFKGIKLSSSLSISHMFYADDAVFMGQWYDGNITTLGSVLISRFESGRIYVSSSYLERGGRSVKNRLSKWKMKTLSIGGNDDKIAFWEDIWIEGKALKNQYPRIYSLETCKLITVGMKLAQTSLDSLFRRVPRSGVEQEQFDELSALVHDVTLTPMSYRWIWALESLGDFSVASVRKVIDDKSLPKVDPKTWWIKYVPIKVNVHA
nr:RNA-directed DNA polymerase, eukaryota [Tanacetum cinerariifolium]